MPSGLGLCQRSVCSPSSPAFLSRSQAVRSLLLGGAVLTQFPVPVAAAERPPRPLQQAYDSYSDSYDELDDGPIAQLLGLPQLRKQLLRQAHGQVLEVGVGTGLNLPLYNWAHVQHLTALDLSPGMLSQAQQRARASSLQPNISFEQGDVTQLPFPEGSFDCLVDTFSLCVFERPQAALNEMARVLKSGGQLLLLEHTISSSPLLSWYQDFTADAVTRTSKGCVWNQRVLGMVRQAGLSVESAIPAVAGSIISLRAVNRAV
ncbi:hypothetical protein WJX74_005337 [Apatococcus lobatus]|uniref:Methyltransferase type 11 domain-containing protein n=1 Tax=Apatococcus lobatus TaxID=904363 RepID=A0AAW1S6A4_9CHLO